MNANGNESRPPKFIRLRRLLSKGAGWLFPRGESHALSRTITLRGLGAVYLTAILSWWAQVDELVCRDGLVPMAPWLDQVGEVLREREIGRWAALPTLFWFADSDTAIHAMCAIGTVLAVAVVAGLAPGPCLAGLWLIYLSLAGTGDVFMHFQWDILLLEAGFLAIFLAPWKVRRLPWRGPQPMLGWGEKFALWLQWIVVAKLMFQSGWVKLAWATPRQPEWWPDFSAMTYHYLTQPIPSWTSWWMHRLPEWWHKAEIWPMYGVELVLPFFVFLGARLRLVAALGFAGLMLSILATGNFAYFNWLTIVLSIPLVADRYWSAPARLWRRIRKKPAGSGPDPTGLSPGPNPVKSPENTAAPGPDFHDSREIASVALRGPPLAALLALNAIVVLEDFHFASRVPDPVLPRARLKSNPVPEFASAFRRAVDPWHFAGGYGLFRTMTIDRPEIVLEGTRDGIAWREYDARWKPDRLDVRPRFVAPHQPRVAWQFWFAALERQYDPRGRNARWFSALVSKLLENDPVALRLFEENPFPGAPPLAIRAKLYAYEFTTLEERRRTGNWWKRRELGPYLMPVSKSRPRL